MHAQTAQKSRTTSRSLIATTLMAIPWMQAQAADESRTFEIYGFAQTDLIQDFQRVDPDWDDAFRPSKIPTQEGVNGGDGQSSVSVKQSRFGVKGTLPTGKSLGAIGFKFEFDLFGTGADAGQTTFRLRHVYGEWGPFLAGQTNTLFMDGDVFPNTIDYWGPIGMVFYRNVQLRWTAYRTEAMRFAVALERPGNDIDPGEIRHLDPALGDNLRNDEELPDLTAQWYLTTGWGHLQVAGILRRVGFETIGTPDNEPNNAETGWGVNLSGHLNTFGKDRILAQVVYGEGIASYMNDGGTDLGPDGSPADPHAAAVPTLGVMLYYDHFWSDTWASSIGYSVNDQDNTDLQSADAFKKGQYASVNLLYTPTEDLLMGAEVLWGEREDNDGATGDDTRLQLSFKYSFGSKL